MAPNKATASDELTQIDPALILADDNIRFNLKKPQVEKLANDILTYGGVHTPIEVEPLDTPTKDGQTYRLTVGHYRHAAVTKLNAESAAGLTLPALVRAPGDETARLRRQLSENVDRENLSPMDMAVAIDRLLKANVARKDIRLIFSRPLGKKGQTYQPASNAWVNIVHRLLELPKAMQEKVHDGRVGLAAAYELSKVAPDRRAAVLERAEGERLKQIDIEEADEEKFLKTEQKALEIQAKADEAATAVETAKAEKAAADKLIADAKAALKAAGKVPDNYLTLPPKEQKVYAEKVEAAKLDLKGAEAAAKKAAADVEKLAVKAKAAQESAADKAKRLLDARKAKAAGKGTAKTQVGPRDVQKAAKAEGEGPAFVALNASEMRRAVAELKVASYPTVTAIAEAIERCFSGEETPTKLLRTLADIVREPNRPKTKLATAPAKV